MEICPRPGMGCNGSSHVSNQVKRKPRPSVATIMRQPRDRSVVLEIRSATNDDRDAIWDIFHEIVAAGDTYAFDPKISRDEALAYWFRADTHTYVAEKNDRVIGTYILRANQPGLGSHVANAAFMVASDAQGSGVGRRMAEHCLSEGRRLGFRAMQFNFVVSTNTSAIHLWEQLGFKIVGTLPGAFRHPKRGYVDVYVMFQSLI
jgi:ribosomal protein S18 acetylase RimI-like enzyme